MIIQANHLNFNYQQKVQAQQDGKTSGLSLGGVMGNGLKVGNKHAAGLSPQLTRVSKTTETTTSTSQIQDRVDVFGDLMGRYLNGFQDESGETKDSTGLVSSLKNTVSWIENQYGKDAATASMGMIVQSASQGQSEEAIGEGLLNVLRMVDRNFGIAAGDTAIAQFNSGVNQELNDFFDNGSNEIFMASSPAAAATAGSETAALSNRVLTQVQATLDTVGDDDGDDEEINPTKELLNALLADIEEQGGIEADKDELDKTAKQQSRQQALAAYTTMPAPDAQLLSASV
mgnify:FL=1